MSEHRETLSAVFDGEGGELEYRRLLRDLDDTDAATWSRWQLARDLMHGHDNVAVPQDFAAGVRRHLGSGTRRSRWSLAAARVMVAASVAGATVVGWQFWSNGIAPDGAGSGQPPVAGVMERAARMNTPTGEAALVRPARQKGQAERVAPEPGQPANHLRELMMRHNELSARHGFPAMGANARLVNQDPGHEQ